MTDAQIDEMLDKLDENASQLILKSRDKRRAIVRSYLTDKSELDRIGAGPWVPDGAIKQAVPHLKPELSERVKLLAMMAAHIAVELPNAKRTDAMLIKDSCAIAERILSEVENRQK